MELIRTEHLVKIYGAGERTVRAVDDVSLCIERGEFVALVGPSGSGKSTFLHMLGGVDTPTSGKIFIEGRDIAGLSSKELAHYRRRKVGLIYQFYNLIPDITIRHNIELPLVLDKRKIDKVFLRELAARLGIEDKLDAFPGELSGGEQQRAAIARSLIYRPSLILADEPTGNLDRENSKEIIEILKYFNRSLNQAILLITHDEKIAMEAERIVTFVDGKVVADAYNA
ncbi:Lipoprotein-releasing system ATP-binding protein LolD [Aedoeadaptatus ivorii]|uniref:Lipoprotein-releasing system ATP-binding protein LolD n=1 Tax=Aedoeadaptatus ivorii TaxID=54006 RepID=A0A3S5F7X2_9FIRM|nr:ABC transporter ATP-binding protein [Peptoniphilus ivorii]MDQ0508200.1 putative ABC transport system ATP-binding protein [Peptoniphilus ivorii]VEJ35930.1 Lipoprotein-releasing system ATP-binding protein LolD [Peptoniphilus ivorii]